VRRWQENENGPGEGPISKRERKNRFEFSLDEAMLKFYATRFNG
jgi:hypothetical protein